MAGRLYRFFSITTEEKSAWLDDAWASAKANEITLWQSLINRQLEDMKALRKGVTLKAASSNGHSAMSHDPGSGAAAPAEYVKMWGELKMLFTQCKTFLINPPPFDPNGVALIPIPNPTDAQIYAQMSSQLVPITETQSDYWALRTPPGLVYS